MTLDSLLEAVAKGKLSPQDAKDQIKKIFEEKSRTSSSVDEDSDVKGDGLKGAFDKFKRSVHIDEILKKSSGMVHTWAENMPKPFEKLSPLATNFNSLAFSSQSSGVDSKLSVFRAFETSGDSSVRQNLVVGSQWFGIQIAQSSQFCSNKFTAAQLSEVALTQSQFTNNIVSLARLSNIAFQSAKYENNKLTRSTWSDVSLENSEITECKLSKTGFAQTVFTQSSLKGVSFAGVEVRDCEFEDCQLEGIEFENCSFVECMFTNIRAVAREKVTIRNQQIQGRNIADLKSASEFLLALSNTDMGVALSKDEASQRVGAVAGSPNNSRDETSIAKGDDHTSNETLATE